MNRREILTFLAIYGTVAGIGGIATAFSHDAVPAPMAEAYSYSLDAEDFDALQDFAAAAQEDQRGARDGQLAGGYRGPGLSRKRVPASGTLRRSR